MSLGLKSSESNVAIGLGTFTYTVQTAGLHGAVAVSSVLPPSGLSIVIQQNGTTVASSLSPSASSQIVSAYIYPINCAVGDVISFILSSSNSNDTMLNTAKTIIRVQAGEL